MAEGTNSFQGLGVPLLPATGFEIAQQTASSAVDIVSLTAGASGTGDFLITQTSAGTEKFTVEDGGNITVTGAAGDVLIKATQAASPTVDAIQVLNSNASRVFAIDSTGAIRTQILASKAIASLASNASASYALTGLTTDDVVQVYPTSVTLATGNGWFVANCAASGVLGVFAYGGSVAANTVAVQVFRTAVN